MKSELEYKAHKDREKRIKSAITAIKAILPLELYPAHKIELLSVCLWKITEADGKFKIRYWSKGVLAKLETGSKINDIRSELIHEHVHTRKDLIDRLLSEETVDSVVEDTIACIVTKAEHNILGKSLGCGWPRYKNSNIRVYDTKDKKWLE